MKFHFILFIVTSPTKYCLLHNPEKKFIGLRYTLSKYIQNTSRNSMKMMKFMLKKINKSSD